MDRETLRNHFKFAIGILEGIAKWTPTELDDNLLSAGRKLIEEDWFVDGILFIVKLVLSGRTSEARVAFADLTNRVNDVSV